MNSPAYHCVRFTWLKRADLDALTRDLRSEFEVKKLHTTDPGPVSFVGHDTKELFLVKADTLQAYLSPVRATLFQKERRPFTERDVKLRERIFIHYPRNRSTPFPWGFTHEPSFEVEKN